MPAFKFGELSASHLINFANERHGMYLRKCWLSGVAPPAWANPAKIPVKAENTKAGDEVTADPILKAFRFCNVFRELDRVTIWIRENIREPYADHQDLWFMLAVARFVNWPPTLQYLIEHGHSSGTWPNSLSFRPAHMASALEQWKRSGNKVETGAYMIRAESDPKKEWYSWSKQRYISEIVLGKPWRDRAPVEFFFKQQRSLQDTWEALRGEAPYNFGGDWTGWGPFMCGQVVADLRHTRYLRTAPDVGRWAPVGPGSMRGLNRLAGRPLKQTISQEQGIDEMLQLQELVNKATGPWVPPIELHDIQNCLCETDKYLRVKSGEGKPRAAYVPGRGH